MKTFTPYYYTGWTRRVRIPPPQFSSSSFVLNAIKRNQSRHSIDLENYGRNQIEPTLGSALGVLNGLAGKEGGRTQVSLGC